MSNYVKYSNKLTKMFQGWYISAYALGIFHLNLFIAFLSPKIDPSFEMAESLGEIYLPLKMESCF